MADSLVTFGIDIKLDEDAKRLLSGEAIERATARTVERLVDRAEEKTLITQYTQNAKPAKPAGSKYIRTFRLQRSSKKEMVSRSLPNIEGKWEAKTAYASYVIGKSSDQAVIHSGRWPTLETVIRSLKIMDQRFFDEEIKKERLG